MFSVIIASFQFELKNIFKSKGLISILFLGPLIYGILYPQPYVNEVMREVPVAVVNLDQSIQSRALIRDLNATDTIKIQNFTTLASAEKALRHEDVFGVLVIPYNFEKDVISKTPVVLPFYGDASYILIYNNIATTVSTVVANLSSELAIKKLISQGVDPSVAQGNTLKFTPTMIQLFNPQSGYATYIIPPAFILILHQILFLGIVIYSGLYRVQEQAFLQTCTARSGSLISNTIGLLLGKLATYLLIFILFFWFYFWLIHSVYAIPNLASAGILMLYSVCFVSATTLFAIFCASFVKTLDAIFIVYVPLSMIFFFLVGVSWPTDNIPDALVYASQVIPATTSMLLSTELSQMGATLSMVFDQFALLICLAILYFALSLWRLMTLYRKTSSQHE